MKSILDNVTKNEIIARIDSLTDKHSALWGKMNVLQMLKHCTLCEEMYLGKTTYKRTLIGYLFGKIALRKLLQDESPKKKNAPSLAAMRVTENGDIDFDSEKNKWISLIEEYQNLAEIQIVHPFWGRFQKTKSA
jgi:hypothetical protein